MAGAVLNRIGRLSMDTLVLLVQFGLIAGVANLLCASLFLAWGIIEEMPSLEFKALNPGPLIFLIYYTYPFHVLGSLTFGVAIYLTLRLLRAETVFTYGILGAPSGPLLMEVIQSYWLERPIDFSPKEFHLVFALYSTITMLLWWYLVRRNALRTQDEVGQGDAAG